MTKEELKKEAEVFATYYESLFPNEFGTFYKAFLKVAEPREKRIEELIALINAERERQEKCDDIHLRKIADLEKENADQKDQLTKAKDIILKLYNAGRDVLMCRAEEKAYDNLENAINDKSIEQFLEEIEK